MLVPVISIDGKPLMPTKPSKARRLIKERKATPFFKKGMFCIKLNFSTTEYIQDIILGLDPGSKRTGISICTRWRTTKTIFNQDLPSNIFRIP